MLLVVPVYLTFKRLSIYLIAMKDVKDDIIKDLEEKLDMAEQVKASEVMYNKTLKDHIARAELHIETLLEINEKFRKKVLKYKSMIDSLVK